MSFFKNISNSFKNAGVLAQLIVINSILFILLNLFINLNIIPYPTVIENLGLSYMPSVLLMHVWGLFTYMFVHIDIGHLFFNMLSFFFMGQLFNAIIGNHRMLYVYIMGGLFGGLIFILTGNIFAMHDPYLAGASPAVMAVIVSCGFYMPNMPIQLLLFGEVKVKWVVLILFLLTSVIDISTNTGGKSAHIGGALFGMIYALQLKRGRDISLWFTKLFSKRTKSHLKIVHNRGVTDEDYNYNKADEQRMLDEILDKINRSGYESLSSKDKETLHRLSKKK